MLPTFLRRPPRIAILGVLIAVLALLLGFVTFSPNQALSVVTYAGYWVLLATILLFAAALYRILAEWWREWRFTKTAVGVVATIVACGFLLQVHEPRGFKILMDEIMLLGSSMSLHLDKTPLVPLRGNDLEGAFQLLSGMLDKRPLFFPVLLSIVHDLTGYRPENAFWLNGALTFVFLGLVYLIGQRLAGIRGGILAVLLMATLPLLGQNATGGGFELLNVVMQALAFLLAIRYLERKDDISLSAFCLATVLLAQTRYESVIFVLPAAAVVLWTWWREGEMRLPWPVLLCPLLLVPYPLQNRVFDVRAQSWELSSQPGYTTVFSPAYVYDNIGHALNFFFDFSGDAPNSPLLAGAGLLATPFLLLILGKRLRRWRELSAIEVALNVFTATYFILGGLLLCYFWGKFDDPVIRRLSLPLHLFMVIAVLAVLGQLSIGLRTWRAFFVATVAVLFGWSIPVMARHAYSLQYVFSREIDWRREFMAEHPLKDYVVIDNSSIIWITHEVTSTTVGEARARKPSIDFLLRNHSFSAIYVWQHFDVDTATHALKIDKDDDLGPDFVLQTVEDRRLKPLSVTRLARVVAVTPTPVGGKPAPPPVDFAKLSPAEREKMRQKYFETWLKNLP